MSTDESQNVVVERLILYFVFRGFRVKISDRWPAVFSLFSSVSPGKFWDSTLNYAKTDSLHIFYNLSFTSNPFIRRYTVEVTEKVS